MRLDAFELGNEINGPFFNGVFLPEQASGRVLGTPVTAPYGNSTQVICAALASYPSISSVTLTVTNASYTDPSNFSNVEIQGTLFNGVAVPRQHQRYDRWWRWY